MTRRKPQIKCALCEKKIISKGQSKAIVQVIDGMKYTFDKVDCMLMFKKFQAVHGSRSANHKKTEKVTNPIYRLGSGRQSDTWLDSSSIGTSVV
jgi:hypothetical protein